MGKLKLRDRLKILFRGTTPSNPAQWLTDFYGGTDSTSGVKVNTETALGLSAYWACVKVIAETAGSTSLFLYERTNEGKKKAISHPLYRVLNVQPNPNMSPYQWKELTGNHVALTGNSFSQIIRNEAGEVVELWPLRPDKMTKISVTKDNKKIYTYSTNNKDVILMQDDVLQVAGFGYDGIRGYDPVTILRNTIGHAIATEEFGQRFFANDARPGGFIEVERELSDPAYKRLKAAWNEQHQAHDKKHSVAILEEGAKWHEVGIAPDNAQFIETMKNNTIKIAEIFRMPPHMIQSLDNATFSNIEHQSLEFVKYTMTPWFVRIEESINTQLLKRDQQLKYFAEFNVNSLLRGDIVSRFTAYRTGREIGVLSSNEIRNLENMNGIGEKGNEYNIPLNWVELGAEPVQPKAPAVPAEQKSDCGCGVEHRQKETRTATNRHNIARSYFDILKDINNRLIRKEIADIKNSLKKFLSNRSEADFKEWLEKYYSDNGYSYDRLYPVYLSLMKAIKSELKREIGIEMDLSDEDKVFLEEYVTGYTETHNRYQLNSVSAAITRGIENEDVENEVLLTLAAWETSLVSKTSRREAFKASNAFAKNMMLQNEVNTLQWVTVSSNCPYCDAMDGKTVGIRENFLYEGEKLNENGAILAPGSNIGHPPLHSGCDCVIIAV